MGFRVSGPHVVAFLEWVRQQYPDEPAFHEIDPGTRRELVRRFKHNFPANLMMSAKELHDLTNNGFVRLMDEGYSVIEPRSDLMRWGGPANRDDALARYRSAPVKGVFLYTDQDQQFKRYLTEFWRALDAESGSLLHFFDYGLDNGIRQKFRSSAQTYTFAEDYIRGLSPIPGANLSRIRAVGLPCLLVWTDAGDSAIIPFADVQGDQPATRERIRAILHHLNKPDVPALRALFEPVVQASTQRAADIFVSYQHEDRAWVETLSLAVEKTGRRVWFDKHLDAGERWDMRIRHMISRAKAVLVVWSLRSIQSEYVLSEAEYARIRKNLIPLFKEKLTPPVPFNTVHALDLSTWSEADPLPEQLTNKLNALPA